jgi:hypothetical protein
LLSAKGDGKGLTTGPRVSGAASGKEPKIHSIAGLQKERAFAGRFQIAGAVYNFEYAPAKGEVVSGKLNLLGELSIVDPRKKKQARKNVRLVLQSTQGGLGNLPSSRMDLPASAQAAAGRRNQAASAGAGDRQLPVTDSTGLLSFVGVMYLRFEPLEGPQLGVPADLSRLQLNARLYPANGLEETLQYLYSHIADCLYGKSPDLASATAFVKDLNQILS